MALTSINDQQSAARGRQPRKRWILPLAIFVVLAASACAYFAGVGGNTILAAGAVGILLLLASVPLLGSGVSGSDEERSARKTARYERRGVRHR